jgi:hypothetical protein
MADFSETSARRYVDLYRSLVAGPAAAAADDARRALCAAQVSRHGHEGAGVDHGRGKGERLC